MASILDNGSFVCFMAIALAGLGVLMAYAIFSRFYKASPEKNPNDEFSQAQYMREVRLRYQGSVANANGYGRKWLQMTADPGTGTGGGHRYRESEASYA